jgi:ElaA protein
MSDLIWHIKPFNTLEIRTLYDILQLRSQIFVVEQNCVYQDLDGKDLKCDHLYAYDNNELVAYCRLVHPNVSYPDRYSIGRVVVNENYRGRELAKQMMLKAIQYFEHKEHRIIAISAQAYLIPFYTNLGFIAIGKPYLEDNIPHIYMEYIKL